MYDGRRKYCPPLGRPPQAGYSEDKDVGCFPAGDIPIKHDPAFYPSQIEPPPLCLMCGQRVPKRESAPGFLDFGEIEPHTIPWHTPSLVASLLATQTQDLVGAINRRLDAMKAEILEEIKGVRDGP